ncbi:hypothetical protein F5J12DRAFT_749220 [Pisolithus orientalis]|uniref:uncharacterized protein n=1 Tax=Pisolithus orientalis TaxID=936130 RepID=UPI002223F9C1|nr:uncharacterized protein F5J12DRAFT_749215 [Pisolithus orientalis]XP_051594257.1 uncharacterized protein F5J12DRAFT_749220 [Pisolithus orientalis]KAI5984908.1 hypothetical protein F5J12DRAFT_749215 [Pisolithus orientalis]KAI5984911.1 hypothetical protein F5J12DRAFT_749220 [Pisolithus orientalis]
MGSSMFRKGELRERGVHITLMIQADIVAFHAPPETPQLGFLQPLVDTACRQHFNPELTVGSATVCCSDHLARYRGKPFREQGFPAAQVSERTGPMTRITIPAIWVDASWQGTSATDWHTT